MADHKHGEMDTTNQEKTFDGFVKFMAWSAIIVIVVLILLAMING